MSVITDFVIANVNEAPAVAAENKPVGKWYGIEYKSIDNIKLMTLYSILKKLHTKMNVRRNMYKSLVMQQMAL